MNTSFLRVAVASALVSSSACTEVLKLDIIYVSGGGGEGAGAGAPAGGAPPVGGAPTTGGGPSNGGGGGEPSGGGGAVPSGGGGSGAQGGGGSPPVYECMADEFNNALPGPCWELPLNEGGSGEATMQTSPTELEVVPNGNMSGWWYDNEGFFLYRNVSGNFAAVTRVRATALNDANAPPGNMGDYQMAGLLVRDSAAPGDWVKFEIGRRGPGLMNNGVSVPVHGVLAAATDDNNSAHIWPYHDTGETEGWLGMCRDDDTLYLMHRTGTATTFQLQEDMATALSPFNYSSTVEVGILAGVHTGIPNVRGRFDYVRMATGSSLAFSTPGDCNVVLTDLVNDPAGCACVAP